MNGGIAAKVTFAVILHVIDYLDYENTMNNINSKLNTLVYDKPKLRMFCSSEINKGLSKNNNSLSLYIYTHIFMKLENNNILKISQK